MLKSTAYKVKTFAVAHKFISAIIVIIVVFVGYKIIKAFTTTTGETRYIIGSVQKGTIVAAITGTGQIAAANQVDIKSKASGDISSINVVNGQEVTAGTLLVSIDSRDAQVALENARISMAKLTKAADPSTLLQTQNSLADSVQAQAKANDDLKKSYDDTFVSVGAIFLDLPDTINGLGNLYGGTQGLGLLTSDRVRAYGASAISLRDRAQSSYFTAKQKYDAAYIQYKNVTAKSPTGDREALANNTYDALKSITQAIKDAKTAVDFIKDQSSSTSEIQTNESNLTSWTSKVASEVQDLSSSITSITNAKDSIVSSARDVAQKNAALVKLQSGPDSLDLESQQLDLQQKEYAYQDSFIRAPFDGIVAKINVKKADTISSGASVVTFIAKQQVANISLNEVDVAKVALGQKVTMTFDAIEDLSVTGKVTDIDNVGTVSQGVVTYNVQITLDTSDPRIKTGMSVNAAIATAVEQDVLIVPNSAIKNQGTSHYVLVVDKNTPATTDNTGTLLSTPPTQVPVEIGIADDIATEIKSGVSEGDKIVTRTILTTAKATTSTAPSILNATGATRTGGAGSATRAIGR